MPNLGLHDGVDDSVNTLGVPTVTGITIVYVGVASALDSGDADPMVKIVIEEGNK